MISIPGTGSNVTTTFTVYHAYNYHTFLFPLTLALKFKCQTDQLPSLHVFKTFVAESLHFSFPCLKWFKNALSYLLCIPSNRTVLFTSHAGIMAMLYLRINVVLSFIVKCFESELGPHCVYVCRYLYCVQLCDDIRRNRVRVDRETAIRLTALMLQGTGVWLMSF